ncbi:type II toxin-antitoxin system RelE/ParE family toxin [Chitinophaga silvatica]
MMSQKQMRQAFKHISKDSPKNAAKVIEEIVEAVQKATSNPERYSPDKFKTDNDGSFRAFEKHHYRVSFRFTNNIIRVLRVRHTSMEPLEY